MTTCMLVQPTWLSGIVMTRIGVTDRIGNTMSAVSTVPTKVILFARIAKHDIQNQVANPVRRTDDHLDHPIEAHVMPGKNLETIGRYVNSISKEGVIGAKTANSNTAKGPRQRLSQQIQTLRHPLALVPLWTLIILCIAPHLADTLCPATAGMGTNAHSHMT